MNSSRASGVAKQLISSPRAAHPSGAFASHEIPTEFRMKQKATTILIVVAQTVDKVSHYCAGFFFAKYQNVQCLCGLLGDFLV